MKWVLAAFILCLVTFCNGGVIDPVFEAYKNDEVQPVLRSPAKSVVCAANRMFIKDCNTCWCNEDGTSYFCTRKVCVDDLPDEISETPIDLTLKRRARSASQQSAEAPHFEPLIKWKPKNCQPGQEFRLDCNQCLCDNEGYNFSCTRIDCSAQNRENNGAIRRRREVLTDCAPGSGSTQGCNNNEQDLNLPANLTKINHQNLPAIQDGQSCVSGKLYKVSCNTCRCGLRNNLMCTKMACLDIDILKQMRTTKHNQSTGKKDEKTLINKNKMETAKDYPRAGTNDKKKLSNKNKMVTKANVRQSKLSTAQTPLPNLPDGECVPGRTYSKGCKKCFCNNNMIPLCTNICMKQTLLSSHFFDEDILELDTERLSGSVELPHIGAECVAGKSYYVQCNNCLCSDQGDLYCTSRYCVDLDSYSELDIVKLKDQPCDKDYTKNCIFCKCKNKKSSCKLLKNCNKMLSGKQLLSDGSSNIKLALDVKKEKCTPNITYKVHCNDCYCQPEGDLRCTQKVCLTYTQIKDLQKREAYLEKFGL